MSELLRVTVELLRALNANTGALMVLLTAFYVYYTRRILLSNRQTLEEVKEQVWQANRAYVNLRLTIHDRSLCMLELSNDGKTPAHSVRLALDRDIFQMMDPKKRINDLPMFSETFEAIPAGARYSLYLWPGAQKAGTDVIPSEFKVTATYEAMGRPVSEVTALHIHMLEGTDFPPAAVEESLEKLPRILDEIRKTLEKIVWRFNQGFFQHE